MSADEKTGNEESGADSESLQQPRRARTTSRIDRRNVVLGVVVIALIALPNCSHHLALEEIGNRTRSRSYTDGQRQSC